MNQASLEPYYITVMKALRKMGQKTAGLEMIIGSCVERLSNQVLYVFHITNRGLKQQLTCLVFYTVCKLSTEFAFQHLRFSRL